MRPYEEGRSALPVLLALPVLAVAVGGYLAVGEGGGGVSDAAEPEPLCGAGADVARATFLFDLRKPLDPVHAELPGTLLRRAATEMGRDTELSVYALSPHAEAPRTLLGRLCKTVDLAGLAAGSAKNGAADDCDLPAQAPPGARASAREFCRERDALARRVDALAVETLGRSAGPAYLVEALEATAREFDGTPGTLHVFSDLLQHAPWFSHAETPLADWQYERMAAAWAELPMEQPLRGFPPGTSVRIHYVPRVGTTVNEDGRAAHKRFWAGYFDGVEAAFDDQPPMAGYLPESLADTPTPMELAAYELERLRHSGTLVERERSELAEERRELEAERERLAAERRELEAARDRLEARAATLAVASPPPGEDSLAAADIAGDGT